MKMSEKKENAAVIAVIAILILAAVGLAYVIFAGYLDELIGGIFLFGGILLALVTIWCWKCKANFGFCVFGIAAFGVFMTGHC
jgi:hypothetical protein